MTRTQRVACIHPHAAEDAAWDAFFTGAAMSWLTGEREVSQAQEARQNIAQADDEQAEEEDRHDLLAAEWEAHKPVLAGLVVALVVAAMLGAFS
jgi:hypothetical protein